MEFFRINQRVKLFSVYLELGALYDISYMGRNSKRARFISVTKSGYNFFDETTNKCVLGRLIYPVKEKTGNADNRKFCIMWGWQIKKINFDEVS
jgi:hypothetical protein